MRVLIETWYRILALLQRRRLETDLDDELAFHLAMREEENIRAGAAPTIAGAAAHRQFGNVTVAKEQMRDAWMFRWLEDWVLDCRFALRGLRQDRSFTLIALLTLALGIGANTAIFSTVHAVLLQPLPFKGADRLVRFTETLPASRGPSIRFPGMDLVELDTLRAHTQTLSHIVVVVPATMTWARGDDPIRVQGTQVSPATFPMLDAQAQLGRTFEEQDETAAVTDQIVLSHAAWRRYFAADPNVIGHVMTLDERPFVVSGVMPADFAFPDAQSEFWVRFVRPAIPPGGLVTRPAFARVRDGVVLQVAVEEVNAILRDPTEGTQSTQRTSVAVPPRVELIRLQDFLVAPVRSALLILMAAVGVVLLIACVNVANLLLARIASRQHEIAVRVALGAGRSRLIRQTLTESLLLAVGGGAFGTSLAFGGIRWLRTLGASALRFGPGITQDILPRLQDVRIDGSVLVFTLGVALATGVLCGLTPAIRDSRRHSNPLRDHAGSPASGFRASGRLEGQGLLVIAEVGLALMLFICGGLLMHSFVKLSNIDPGFDLTNVLTFQVTQPRGRSQPQFSTIADAISARLRSEPNLTQVGFALSLPMVAGGGVGTALRATPAPAAPPPALAPASADRPLLTAVSQDFLNALGIRLVAGRGFSDQDGSAQPPVMLVNRTVANGGFLGDNPIGKHVYGFGPPIEVVGIVDDIRQLGLTQKPIARVFVDLRQFPPSVRPFAGSSSMYYAVRTEAPPSTAEIARVRALVRQVEPQATVDNIATMGQLVSNSISRPRLYAVLLALFAAIAVALATVGIYGVMSYSVTQRTREIGIRVALGATPANVMGLVLRQSIALTFLGIIFGLASAGAVTRYLRGLLFGLTPLDPGTYFVVAIVFGLIAVLAAAVPTRRATRVDPLHALRYE